MAFVSAPIPVSKNFLPRSRKMYANAALTSQFTHLGLLSFSGLESFKLEILVVCHLMRKQRMFKEATNRTKGKYSD
jgi:hypothetical protein